MRLLNRVGGGCLGVLLLASCHQQPLLPPAQPHYVIGGAWQGDGTWFYPSESFELRQTGLAVREANQAPHITADGEIWSASSMTGAHQTLQLPAIVSVRNLANGRIVRVRLNERGPAAAGRMLALSPQAAVLLGMSDSPAPIELIVDEAASRALAEASPDAPRLDIQTAPRGEVMAQSLNGGVAERVGRREDVPASRHAGMILTDLPQQFQQGMAQPVSYIIALGGFSGRGVAWRVASRCGGTVAPATENGHGLSWEARLGPFGTVQQADAGLAQARVCGIAGARIVVE